MVRPTRELPGAVDADGNEFATLGEVFRDDFGGTALDATKWFVNPITGGAGTGAGTGMAYSVTGSELVITTGVTSGDEIVFRSKKSWKADNIRAEFQMRLSQRIANQLFSLRLTNAAGTSYVEWAFDGTTATSQKTQSAQASSAWTAAATSVPTTVTNPPTWNWVLAVRSGKASWMYRLIHLAAQSLNVYVERERWIPLPDEDVFLEIRAKNTGTAASTTTFAIDVVHLQHGNPAGVTIEAGSGDPSAARAIPVSVVGSVSTGIAANSSDVSVATGGGTTFTAISAATTNATSVKASAGRLHSLELTNTTVAMKFFKLYNKASAPTVGTDTPVMTIGIPPTNTIYLGFGAHGKQCATGIAYAVTGASPVSDTTATAIGDVLVNGSYT